jgi:hypothetical protein
MNEVTLTDGTVGKMLQNKTFLKGEEFQAPPGAGRNFAL